MCSNPKTPWLTYANEGENTMFWFRADCKLWSCEECANRKKTRVAARAGRGVEDFAKMGITVKFITLTCHEKVRGFDASIKRWREAWPRLRKRATYHADEFHYVLIPEQHKTGAVHVHLLATGEISQRWWKDNSRACGLGYMAKARACDTYASGAQYATKYLTKSAGILDWPPRFHRFRFSQKWPDHAPDDSEGEQWRVFLSGAAFDDEARYWFTRGFKIVNTRTGELA